MSYENLGKLLGDGRWAGKIFNGSWTTTTGGTRDIPEAANGNTLWNVGFADAADTERSAAVAAAAAKLASGEVSVYQGPINDNKGNEVLAAGETLDSMAAYSVSFAVEGVTGA